MKKTLFKRKEITKRYVHIKMKQANPDNKKCIECGKVFNRPSAARKHEREVCNPGKTCRICGKHLTTAIQWSRHQNNHKRKKDF